jgi:MFS family permease
MRWGFRKLAVVGFILVAAGLGGLLVCTILGAPHWVLTAVLAITGCGFGPASMSTLLAAQGAVEWQQRGIITSSVTFFRTVGGAIGVGLLGALFNVLIRPHLARLMALGVTSRQLLDPLLRQKLPPTVLAEVSSMIGGGLIWVFAAMFFFSLLGVAVSFLMPRKMCDHVVSRTEAMEALAG